MAGSMEVWKQKVVDAVCTEDSDLLEMLLRSPDKQPLDFHTICASTPLINAVTLGNENMVEQLINAGASVNFSDGEGCTPLISLLATEYNGNVGICRLLLRSGADANASYGSRTPLYYAAECNYCTCALLLEYGAVLHDPSKPWKSLKGSPIAIALLYQGNEVLELFLKHYCNSGLNPPLELVFNLALQYHSQGGAITTLNQGYCPPVRPSALVIPQERCSSYFRAVALHGFQRLMTIMAELNPQVLQEVWLIQGRIPDELYHYGNFVPWLIQTRRQPASLTKLCRTTILYHLGIFYIQKVQQLPLPSVLKKFLNTMEST